MSDFVPNNRYLQEVLLFLFNSIKTAVEAYQELKSSEAVQILFYWIRALKCV